MSNELIRALQNPSLYEHPVTGFQVVETHISWVILTGDYAYKIKKPMNFGFLDFSTLEARKGFCEKELQLNRRLAPQLYLDVLPISGSPEKPELGGTGEAFEYAIKMRQFDQSLLLDRLQERGELTFDHADQLADGIAAFHSQIQVADTASDFGTPEQAYYPVQQNFDQIRPLLNDAEELAQLGQLEAWAQDTFNRLKPCFQQRKADGFIRECHGDIHLGNITVVDGKVTLFDCIEFNEAFRWTDVMCDIAFLIMDLEDRGLRRFANHILNRYLEHTGDYAGLELLGFYKSYRALVRAKVALFTLGAPGLSEEDKQNLRQKYRNYAELAESYTYCPNPCLLITHGLSGSGKSTLSGELVNQLGLVRLRSDIERKRLHGLDALQRSESDLDGGIYTANATQATYQRLADLADALLQAGFGVIADATFLKQAQRQLLELVAENHGAPFVILSCEADLQQIRDWIHQRHAANNDASEADLQVLQHQQETQEPLSAEEMVHRVQTRTDQPEQLQPLIELLSDRLCIAIAER